MRTIFPIVLVFMIASVLAVAQTSGTKSMTWEDSTRDTYIDGHIDRDAQILVRDNEKSMVLFSSKLSQAVLINTTEGTVGSVNKDAFKFAADHVTAKSDSLPSKVAGRYTKIAGVYNFPIDGKMVSINRHEGALGEITEEKLWETVPVWHSLMDNYHPNPDAVAALKVINEDTKMIVILGTWCHDSKREVPRLLRALETANNKKIQVKLIALDFGFTKSLDVLQHYQVTNTPTVIVERNGREIGRINETPAVPLIEDDLVAILRGKTNVHPGTSDHGPQLAQGTYQYLDGSAKETGTEQWQLYSTTSGGRLIHSEISKGDVRTEVYYETNAKARPVFVEITIRRGDHIVRQRSYIENQKLFAHLTGDPGVLDQHSAFGEQSAFSSPSMASEALGWEAATEPKATGPVSTFFALSDLNNVGGYFDNIEYEGKGEELIHTPAGDFRGRKFLRKTKSGQGEWYVHPQLGIPVKIEIQGGGSVVLTSLQIAAAK